MSHQVTHIVRELHDEPHIEGRRITVQLIKECVEDRGFNPRTVADRYELDIAEVYHALAYYYDHLDEMRTVKRQRQQAIDEYEHLTTDPETVGE